MTWSLPRAVVIGEGDGLVVLPYLFQVLSTCAHGEPVNLVRTEGVWDETYTGEGLAGRYHVKAGLLQLTYDPHALIVRLVEGRAQIGRYEPYGDRSCALPGPWWPDVEALARALPDRFRAAEVAQGEAQRRAETVRRAAEEVQRQGLARRYRAARNAALGAREVASVDAAVEVAEQALQVVQTTLATTDDPRYAGLAARVRKTEQDVAALRTALFAVAARVERP